VGIVTLRIRWQ